MLTQSEEKIRQVEMCVDKYHKKLKILRLPRQIAILYVLRAFENFCRFPLSLEEIPIENYEMNVHNYFDGLNSVIKWIFEECECQSDKFTDKYNGKYYEMACEALNMGENYYFLCGSFTLWSRKELAATLDCKKKRLTFNILDTKSVELHASDVILFQRKKILEPEKCANIVEYLEPYMQEAEVELLNNIQVIDDRIVKYKITPLVWNAFNNLCELQISYMFELPEDWKFAYFTLKDFRRFWCALLSIALIHIFACMKFDAIENVILIINIEQLNSEITRRTGLDPNIVNSIANYLTYNPKIRKVDVAWQPLIPLDRLNIAIAPHLIIKNNIERNLITLINKIEQASYSRLSSIKEDIMVSNLYNELLSQYPNLKISIKKKLPNNLPDMDLVIYDLNDKSLFVGELKWLLPFASVQEALAREDDLRKGLSQANIIRKYIDNHMQDCVIRAFGIEKLEVKEIFVCVISKNNTGSISDNLGISVISEDSFRQLIQKFNGNMKETIDAIKSEQFLPASDEYKITRLPIDYAGYKIIIPIIKYL
jgi:hypothetical protein